MNLFILNSALKSGTLTDLFAWAVYLIAIIGSSLLAALVSPRQNRLGFIYVWLLLGIITSLLLSALAMNVSFGYLLIIMLFSGVAFGLGMPSALAYFAEYTVFENRGRTGGIILLLTFLVIPFVSLLPSNFPIDSYIATIWRAAGLIAFLVVRPLEKIEEPKRPVRFSFILSDRGFLLFLIPWFMAWLIDRFEYQIFLEKYTELSVLSLSIEPIVGTVFVIVAGLLADWIGRKKVVVSGFIALGFGYAVLGFAAQTILSQYFYIVIDGIAWGIFFVLFILVLWGDLSMNTGGHEKYYAVGSIPFFVAYLMQYVALPYIKSIPIQAPEVSFSFASLFLFVAILPLIYAPETLPQKKIRERQIKKYVEEAKKIAERESVKIEA
jgi:MFS family permease